MRRHSVDHQRGAGRQASVRRRPSLAHTLAAMHGKAERQGTAGGSRRQDHVQEEEAAAVDRRVGEEVDVWAVLAEIPTAKASGPAAPAALVSKCRAACHHGLVSMAVLRVRREYRSVAEEHQQAIRTEEGSRAPGHVARWSRAACGASRTAAARGRHTPMRMGVLASAGGGWMSDPLPSPRPPARPPARAPSTGDKRVCARGRPSALRSRSERLGHEGSIHQQAVPVRRSPARAVLPSLCARASAPLAACPTLRYSVAPRSTR
jgi:hypothetical protein